MIAWYIIAFIVGSCFGSLGSVLMTRLSEDCSRDDIKGILRGRSKCFDTGRPLHRRELIPFVSFLVLKGKTHTSKKSLPRYYLVLELGTGVLFMLTLRYTGQTLGWYEFDALFWGLLVFGCLINWLLWILFVWDIQTYTLHTPLWWGALIASLIPQFFGWIGNYQIAFYSSLVFGGGYALIYLGAQYYMKRKTGNIQEAFGQGDIYVGFLIGTLMSLWFTGFKVDFDILTLFNLFVWHILLSSIIGLLWGGRYWIKERTINFQQMIPFFPAMIIAFWILMIRK